MTACAARFDPAVEAAVMARYGVDTLADPGPSPRRMHTLLSRMPYGTFPDREHADAWPVEAHMLANVVDAINLLTWVEVAKGSKRAPKRPKPVPRPGQRHRIRAADLADALAGVEGVRFRE